jgi:transposase
VLPPSEKWELFTSVLTGRFTQREAAAKWQVDRSTVTTICRVAKEGALAALSATPGRPGKTGEQVELEQARAEVERLRATITEQAVELHLYRGKSRWD